MLKVLARSMLASGAATVVDLASLFVMVTLLGISPRVASIPALLLAATVQFTAQRRFAFRATTRSTLAQAMRFVPIHATTLLLNALVFDVAIRLAGAHAPYWAIRLAAGNAVYLAWSFPMLKLTFSDCRIAPARRRGCTSRGTRGLAVRRPRTQS